MEEIIIKECTNEELTHDERLQLKRWLNKSAANRRLYQQMRLSVLSPNPERREGLQQEVWEDLTKKMNLRGKASYSSSGNFTHWIKIAASIALVVGLGLWSYNLLNLDNTPTQVVEVTAIEKMSMPGQKITTYLPDGTMVKLNSGSRLIVPQVFADDKREVTLYGEAFFDVKRDEKRPFTITTKDLTVQVLGTSFNVRAYSENEQSSVAVATGKVAVSKGKKKEYLVPGEKVVYDDKSGLSEKQPFEVELEYGWKDNLLVLDGKNFNEIISTIKSWYGVEVLIENTELDQSKLFSGRYKDPSLKMVLEGISYVYHMEYEINNKTVTIK